MAALFIAAGFLTRAAANPLAFTMIIAAFVIHGDHSFSKQEFPLAYAMAAIAVMIAGPGRFSVNICCANASRAW